MCTLLSQGVTSFGQAVKNSAQCISQKTTSAYNWFDKKVVDLTNRLPKPYNSYAQHALWTLPYTIALISMPKIASTITLIVLAIIPQETVQQEMGQKQADAIYASVRNFCLINAAIDGALFVTTCSIGSLASCILNIYAATQAHLQISSDAPFALYMQSFRPSSL